MMRYFLLSTVLCLCLGNTAVRADEPDKLARDYYSVLTTYACYARSLWHDAPSGGYWGDGLAAKNQNGAVRGTASTLYTYAMLVDGMDSGAIGRRDRKLLGVAGLSRDRMIDYIRKNAAYLVAHHKSAGSGLVPEWGYNWQSSLWMGSLGPGVILVWEDLGVDLKAGLGRVAAAEADWVASRPPKSGSANDTGAEENGWDMHAPAVALALTPEATSATLWWNTLQSYAVNVYSHPSDRKMAAEAKMTGPGRLVTTSNILDDFSLINHGFFHPDYVQVSAQHLGEAWVILAMGDALHGTHMAKEFEPYAKFNVEAVWHRVLRPLLLPWGEFAFPAGNDWTFHCSTNQAYFAYIATAFGDPDAAEAETRGLQHVLNRREAGPAGRLLGDSNLEWWWEPLVAKRCSAALLMHRFLSPETEASTVGAATADVQTTTVQFRDARVWLHRTPAYFASVSWGNPQLGFFAPLSEDAEQHPYMTLPTKFSIMPRGTTLTLEAIDGAPSGVSAAVLRDDGQVIAAVVGLPQSVVWLSLKGFGHISVENDSLTLPGRVIETSAGIEVFKALTKARKASLPGRWLCVNDFFAMASDGANYVYNPAGHWNMKSVAADHVQPAPDAKVWQMAAGDSETAAAMGQHMKVEDAGTSSIQVTVTDVGTDNIYRMKLGPDGLGVE